MTRGKILRRPAGAVTTPSGSHRFPGLSGFCRRLLPHHLGRTRVICAATVIEQVPPFRIASGAAGSPASTPCCRGHPSRGDRESLKGRVGGRTLEIQRLIGRSLRAVVDLAALGPRTVTVDCDVYQADGGTRTASITGPSWPCAWPWRACGAGGRSMPSPTSRWRR